MAEAVIEGTGPVGTAFDAAVNKIAGTLAKEREAALGEAPEKKPAEAQEVAPEAQEEAKAEEKPAEEQAQEEEPKKFKAKVKYKTEDGQDEEREVDEEELVKGFMLEKSYRHKTAQLARQREQLQTEAQQAVQQKVKEYDDKLALAEQVIWHTILPEAKNTDWTTLARENPAEWAQKFQSVQNVNAKLAAIQAERQRIAQAQQMQQQEVLQKQAKEAVEALQERVPGWSNDLYGKILKFAEKEYGFKSEEVGSIVDARAIEVLNDARQWRELKAKPLVEKKVVEQPKAVTRPGVAQEKNNPNAEALKQAKAKLYKSGSRDDGVSYIAELLKAGRV